MPSFKVSTTLAGNFLDWSVITACKQRSGTLAFSSLIHATYTIIALVIRNANSVPPPMLMSAGLP